MHDAREAWSICRQLAGHGPGKVYDKNVPAAKSISRRQWLDHFHSVWGAWSHDDSVVDRRDTHDLSLPVEPVLVGEAGRFALLKAAKSQARWRATPQGALPTELWQLLLQERLIAPGHVSGIPSMCMCLFESIQSSGCNPQAWCDGQGCPLPKPGGISGPEGHRVINLLDPAGKLFYKALFGLVPDEPADHQYGFAPCRSRRDAILQVEAWLDRLRASNFCTATTLFDLTKAFDMLTHTCIANVVTRNAMPPAVRALLLDLHARLRISLGNVEGQTLQVKLESGVLQGGGTGPRFFRMAYDECILQWKERTSAHALVVTYCGLSVSLSTLSTAAYADDLVRVVHGHSLAAVEDVTLACTNSLQTLLEPRGLRLNNRKGETLLSLRGKGAYKSARRAYSGEWKAYPLKLVVKYLGAHMQSNGSMSAEIRKRIGAAKAEFAKFSKFFKRSHVPLPRKFLVFKSVVDASLLSALEVRPLSARDLQTLEQARGPLLRRLFGKFGFGAVAGEHEHRSVTVESLRERAGLATVASELRVRRLLWLRSALRAERQGQVRLDLAALFGECRELGVAIDLDTGFPTRHAARFLHLLHDDMQFVFPGFGFLLNWKDRFLAVTAARIKSLRTCKREAVHLTPSVPLDDPGPEVLDPLMCAECGAGPWQNQRALRTHRVKKHAFRNAVQSTRCPHCSREFTSKTAAQRHVKRQSCGKPANNHGHGGALAGARLAESASRAAAAKAQNRTAPATSVQTTLRAFFGHARDGLSSGSREPCRLEAIEAHSRGWGSHWQQVLGATSSGSLEANAENMSNRGCPRQQHSGDGSLEHPHMASGSSVRLGHTAHCANGSLERATSARASSSSRPFSPDSRGHDRQVGARRARSESQLPYLQSPP